MKLHRLPVISAVSTLFHNPLELLGGVLLCLSPALSPGQSVTFAGTQTSVPTGGFGVAVDERGDVFFAAILDHAVLEALAVNGSIPANPTVLNLGSGFFDPWGVAVDGSGNVFVADPGNGNPNDAVKEILAASGYTTVNTLGSGFFGPNGVAVDGHGNVFVGDTEDNAVKEILAVNGSIPVNPTILTLGSGFSIPRGVAVDGSGNVFVADSGNNAVKEILAAEGYTTVKTLAGGFSYPADVAVDGSGNVFVADFYNLAVKEILASSGYTTVNTLATDVYGPYGVAVDRSGSNVFFIDSNSLRELQRTSVNFGSANVCAPGATTPAPCSQKLTLTYNVNADTTLGEPQVATGGLKHLDFDRASGSTCIGAVTAGTTCTVNVTFAPLAAGFRHGSVSIPDGSGHDITTTQLSGFGVEATTGAPVAQLSTSKLSFGAIDFGTTQTLPLFVANIGGGTLTVSPSISGPSYKIADNTCAVGVTPGNSCTLVVEYSPVSIGTHNDILTITTNGGSPTVELRGSVAGLSVLGGVSGGTLDFGQVSPGDTKVLPMTVTNIGLPGTVQVGTTISGPSYSILTEGNTCLAGIAAGQSCTLPVQFAPAHAGLHNDLLTLTPFPGAGSTTVWLSDNP